MEESFSAQERPSQEIFSPAVDQQPAAPTNIWSAFTPEVETKEAAEVTPAMPLSSAAAFEPDVFAIVNEENDAQQINSSVTPNVSPQLTGSQWVPIEEHMFEFVEEETAAPPLQDFSAPSFPVEETAFGDIAFEGEEVLPIEPDFADFTESSPAIEVPDAPFAPLSDPVPPLAAAVAISPGVSALAASTPVTLTEEQLKEAIANASKEVIERIVWEVVPDLAEALIREAIKKITQGA